MSGTVRGMRSHLRLVPPVAPVPVVVRPRVRHRAGTVRSLQNPATASLIDMAFRATEDRIARVGCEWKRMPRRARSQLTWFAVLCVAVVGLLAASLAV